MQDSHSCDWGSNPHRSIFLPISFNYIFNSYRIFLRVPLTGLKIISRPILPHALVHPPLGGPYRRPCRIKYLRLICNNRLKVIVKSRSDLFPTDLLCLQRNIIINNIENKNKIIQELSKSGIIRLSSIPAAIIAIIVAIIPLVSLILDENIIIDESSHILGYEILTAVRKAKRVRQRSRSWRR